MPNWCSNETYVDVSDIDMSLTEWLNEVGDFKKDDDGKVIMNDDGLPEYFKFDFNKIIPEPDYDDTDGDWVEPTKEFIENRYPWCKDNGKSFEDTTWWWYWRIMTWGTKWNIGNKDYNYSYVDYKCENSCYFEFETAWAPPEGIIKKLNEKYEDITIRVFYREDGNQIAGYL